MPKINIKVVVYGLGVLLVVWLVFGFAPMLGFGFGNDRAGVFGDSFGFVNSLFSGFAFLIATYALILQIQESHDSRTMQEKQTELQTKQMDLAKQTAQIQELIRLDGRRQVAMSAFLKIDYDLHRYVRAFFEWHPENRARTAQKRPDHFVVIENGYFEALNHVKSNLLGIDLIFGESGKSLRQAISDLLTVATRWATQEKPEHTAADSESSLVNLVQRIETDMKPIWDRLNESATSH